MNTHANAPDLSGFLAPGAAVSDVPGLAPLLAARGIVDTFISLFRGSEAEVLLRLLVLREIGHEAEAPRWSPDELRRRFVYLDAVKLETALKRLREHGLLHFAEDGLYHLSDLGRNAVAALGMLLAFSAEEDAELGFLTAQLAGLSATGGLTPESLGHLLSKLNELTWHFEEAIASGSEFRIIAARDRLKANGRWLERGTAILRELLADPEADFDLARVAQRIGLAQSRLARADAAFQRALNKIEAQRVTLGDSGISSSDIAAWLRRQSADQLASLLDGAIAFTPSPALLAGGHELLDRAESVFAEEMRAETDAALPLAEAVPQTATPEQEDLRLLEHFTRRLDAVTTPTPLPALVAGGGFAAASYRFSLLSLLADGAHDPAAAGPAAAFMRLPLAVSFGEEIAPLGDADSADSEIAAMTTGSVSPCASPAAGPSHSGSA